MRPGKVLEKGGGAEAGGQGKRGVEQGGGGGVQEGGGGGVEEGGGGGARGRGHGGGHGGGGDQVRQPGLVEDIHRISCNGTHYRIISRHLKTLLFTHDFFYAKKQGKV